MEVLGSDLNQHSKGRGTGRKWAGRSVSGPAMHVPRIPAGHLVSARSSSPVLTRGETPQTHLRLSGGLLRLPRSNTTCRPEGSPQPDSQLCTQETRSRSDLVGQASPGMGRAEGQPGPDPPFQHSLTSLPWIRDPTWRPGGRRPQAAATACHHWALIPLIRWEGFRYKTGQDDTKGAL